MSLPVVSTTQSEFDIDKPDSDGYPLLVRAAHDGLGDMVERLLASGAKIECVHTKTKRNALIEASIEGHTRIVSLLVDHGCSLGQLDAGFMSALHHAAQNGYLLVAKALLDKGAAVDLPGSNGLTPLYLASWAPHANMVMLLLQRHAAVNARDAFQRTALHVAASRGFSNICATLIEHGVHLESRDANSKTPLQLAVIAEHLEVADLLLLRSNLRPTDTNFLTALFGAIESGNVRMVEGFIDRGAVLKGLKNDTHKPMTLAAKSGSCDMINLMIKKKAKTKEKDNNDWTALHFAAHHGHAAVVEVLTDNHISSRSTTSKKETPLHLAVKSSSFAATELLLRGKGSSTLTSKDTHGQEPLHSAVRGGNPDIVNILFSHKANINAENGFGWKPLHIAVAYGHTALVQQLVNLGASIEERLGTTDYKKDQTHSLVETGYWAEARWPFPGSKPLHLAVEFSRDDIARYLLSRGAKVDSMCGEGWRPLHLAAFNASPAMVEQLLQMGAYPHAATDIAKSRTPLDVARFRSADHITEDDRMRVQELLHAAMISVPKKGQEQWKNMKIITGKGPEEKREYLRAAGVAVDVIGKGPGLPKHIVMQSPGTGAA
ncbi:hypothetical protein MMC28_004086 [Mycoblastus sanguinarius]|nr:hypothetical protein [Mycoblastus sanguinarius]